MLSTLRDLLALGVRVIFFDHIDGSAGFLDPSLQGLGDDDDENARRDRYIQQRAHQLSSSISLTP